MFKLIDDNNLDEYAVKSLSNQKLNISNKPSESSINGISNILRKATSKVLNSVSQVFGKSEILTKQKCSQKYLNILITGTIGKKSEINEEDGRDTESENEESEEVLLFTI